RAPRGKLALGLLGEELGLGVFGRVDDRDTTGRDRVRILLAQQLQSPEELARGLTRGSGRVRARRGGGGVITRPARAATTRREQQRHQSAGEWSNESDNHYRYIPPPTLSIRPPATRQLATWRARRYYRGLGGVGMRVEKQLSVFLDNKPGSLAATCRDLATHDIYIEAIS